MLPAENENRIGRTIEYSDTAPTIYPEEEYNGEFFFNELNFKFWYDTSRLELLVLYKDQDDGAYSYVPVSLPLTNLDLDALNTQVQANSYSNNQQSQAIETLEQLIVQNFEDHEEIKNEIIELEEEIDAIAPSVERGKWTFNALGTVGQAGQFTMYDADFGSGSPTGVFKDVKSVWFNEIDSDGTPHAFADVDDGELLEIFVDGSPEYGLYEVVGQAHDETQGASSFWVIDVNFVRTLETTTAVDSGELCRFKVFMAPTGGDASSFVLKAGDTMTGDLELEYPNKLYTKNISNLKDESLVVGYNDEWRMVVNEKDININAGFSILRKDDDDNNGVKQFIINGRYPSTGNRYEMFYAYADPDGDGCAYYGLQPDRENSAAVATTGFVAKKVNKAIMAAGLQLGEYSYRRNNDSLLTGSIKSNGTTNPKVWTQIDMHTQNKNGVVFGKDFYMTYIVPNMFMRVRDKSLNSTYVAKITAISELSNNVRMVLSPVDDLCKGSFYVDSRYDVSISCSKYF